MITVHLAKRLNGADRFVLNPTLDSEVAVFHNTNGGNAIVEDDLKDESTREQFFMYFKPVRIEGV